LQIALFKDRGFMVVAAKAQAPAARRVSVNSLTKSVKTHYPNKDRGRRR
jgi:hypothetical protein